MNYIMSPVSAGLEYPGGRQPGQSRVIRRKMNGNHQEPARQKYSYCESTTAVHFYDLFRYVEPLCASKDRKTVLAVALSRYGYFYRAGS